MACFLNYEVNRFMLSLVRQIGRLALSCGLILSGLTPLADAAELDPTTLAAWHKYIDLTKARFHKRLSLDQAFAPPVGAGNDRVGVPKGAILVGTDPPRAP